MNFYQTSATLNDGRTIRYFDFEPTKRDRVDLREKNSQIQIGEVRKDLLTSEWVTIAAHRQDRLFLPPKELCPLCPSTNELLTEIPESDYQVVVFDNKSPSFTNMDYSNSIDYSNSSIPAAGKSEVVCFTRSHEGSFGQLSLKQIELVLRVWKERVAELSKIEYIEQITPFENRGEEVGVTLNHPHGQIYAYPFIPTKVELEIEAAKQFFERKKRNLFDFIIEREIDNQSRVVSENEDWIAFVPYAARYPFEVHIAPKSRKPDLSQLSENQLTNFAPIAKIIFQKLDGLFNLPMPYISAWHQAPTKIARDLLGVHLQITPFRRTATKLKYLAGSESAMGAFIMDNSPEYCAQLLKEVKVEIE